MQLCGMVGIRLMHCGWGEKQQAAVNNAKGKRRKAQSKCAFRLSANSP